MKTTTIKQDFTPVYKDLTFNSEQEFKQWLSNTTYKKIFFKCKGQDLMKINIAENGEILHANLQSSIWNGRFVNMEILEKGTLIQFWNIEKSRWDVMNFEIAVIK